VTWSAIRQWLGARRIALAPLLFVLGGLLSGAVVLAVHDGAGHGANQSAGPSTSSPGDHGQSGMPNGRNGGLGRGGPGRGPGQDVRPWWKDPAMAHEVGLTKDQIAKIDRVYEQRQAQIKPKVDEYNKQRDELNRMMRERTAKPAEVEEQARRLSYPRLEIDVSRAKMLYEMSQVMTAEQNTRMRAMFDRMDQERDAMFKRYEQERARGRAGNPPQG